MPCLGLTSFLRCTDTRIACEELVCQCPVSGLLHFYYVVNGKECTSYTCQCPVSGLLHFYKGIIGGWNYDKKSVNALSRAYFISTTSKEVETYSEEIVSMPCLGLTSFLRYLLETLCLCGFPAPFLQVIHRIF